MRKSSSNSLLVCISVLFISFYMGASVTTEDLSMMDILSYGTAEYVAESNSDGIYSVLMSHESSTIESEMTVVSTITSVAQGMIKDDMGTNVDDLENADDSDFENLLKYKKRIELHEKYNDDLRDKIEFKLKELSLKNEIDINCILGVN